MDRRSILKNAGIAGVLAAGVAPAVHAQAAVRWRLASSFPKSLDTLFGGSEYFAKKVKEMSGGKFEITTHAAGELMPAFGVLDGVQNGTVECAHTAPYYFFGKDETFALDCAVPFGLNSRQMTAWMVHGNGMKLMREHYAKYNIVNFMLGNTGTQMGGWFRKEVKSVEDLNGLKMRVGGMAGRMLQRLGLVPQQIPPGDIYPALEKGTIDAAEFVGPYDDERLGFERVAPFYYTPGWWETSSQISTIIGQKSWDSLPPQYKAALAAACFEAHVMVQAKYDVLNPQALARMVKRGVKLRAFPKPVMDACLKACREVMDEEAAKNANFRKLYEHYRRFQNQQNQWASVTEARMQNYQITSLQSKRG